MDTEKRFGLTQMNAILLFFQMILIMLLLVTSIYLLTFVISNKLGGWMITAYIFISLSIISIIVYSTYGYKKGELFYKISIVPFLIAVFVNIILPNRDTFQIILLSLLFILTFVFILRQNNMKFTYVILFLMFMTSFIFSLYSMINADTQFLGDVSTNWPTYLAMYLSIFIPSIVTATFALTYYVRNNKIQ